MARGSAYQPIFDLVSLRVKSTLTLKMTMTRTFRQNKWADPPNEVDPIQVKTRISNEFGAVLPHFVNTKIGII
jgi:hypothetical protein